MNPELSLDLCVVDCDGSACGSSLHVGLHVHQPQQHPAGITVPVARAVVRRGVVSYESLEAAR